MREQVTRLTKLATDLLDLSRLDSGAVAVEQEPVDLAATARTLVREFRGLAARHGSRVVLARPPGGLPHGIGDEQRVQQIGRVLVDNAIRHNPRGTKVRVAVGADNGHVTLTVSDDGPGIDADSRGICSSASSAGRGQPATGSGLGLAIARELAQRMDGRSRRLGRGPDELRAAASGRRLRSGAADVANALARMQRINVGHKSLADYHSLIGGRWPTRSGRWPSRCGAGACCTCRRPPSAAASPRSSTRCCRS